MWEVIQDFHWIRAQSQTHTGDTIYVSLTAVGNNDGSSWANAYKDLKDATNTAQEGDQIWVAKGRYLPGTQRTDHFSLANGVAIYGGFDGTEHSLNERDPSVNKTILSGDIDQNDQTTAEGITEEISGNNSYQIIVISNQSLNEKTILDGFILTGGNSNGSSNEPRTDLGSALMMSLNGDLPGDSLFIHARFQNIIFQRNIGGGPAVFARSRENNTFIVAPIFLNCSFKDNYSNAHGGAFDSFASSGEINPSFIHCSFTGNKSGRSGAALSMTTKNTGTKSSLKIINSVFSNNAVVNSQKHGGAIALESKGISIMKAVIRQSSFASNSATLNGNDIWVDGTGSNTSVTSYNTVFGSNNPIFFENSDFLHINNLIVGSGGSENWNSDFGSDGGNNLDMQPKFVDALNNNLTLQVNSAGLNKADPLYITSDLFDVDADGNINESYPIDIRQVDRVLDGAPEIGAFETNIDQFPTTLLAREDNPYVSGPFVVEVAFDREMQAFDLSKIRGTHVTVDSVKTSNSENYYVYCTPENDISIGETLIEIFADYGAGVDLEGRNSIKSDTLSLLYNTEKPIASFSSSSDTVSGSFSLTLQFDKAISDLSQNDFFIENASLQSISAMDSASYQLALEPEGQGLITIRLNENAVFDKYGNRNTETDYQIIMNNQSPEILSQNTISVNEDEPIQIDLSYINVSDPDNNFPDDHSFQLHSISNATVHGENEVIPEENFNGIAMVKMIVYDNWNNSDTIELEINVNPVNDLPVIKNTLNDIEVFQDFDNIILDISNVFEDIDGDELDYLVTSSDENVATASMSENMLSLTYKGIGSSTIQLSSEDPSGEGVTTEFDLIVNPKLSQTITFGSIPEKVYGENSFTLDVSSSSALDLTISVTAGADLVTINGKEVTILGAGQVTVLAEQEGNDEYYAADPVEQTFTIQKAALSVTADDQTITHGDPMPELTFSYSGFVNGEDASVLDEEPQASTTAAPDADTGTYAITLSGGSDDNYTFSFTEGTLTIGQAAQTITFEEIADVDMANQTSVSLSASASSGLEVTFTLIEGDGMIEGNTLTLNTTGNFVVEASQAGNTNYLPAESVTRSFVVTDSQKEDQSISFEALTDKVYGDAPFTLSATASSGLEVSYTVSGPATLSGNELTLTGAGEVTITADQPGNEQFNPASPVEQSFTVEKASLSVTADDQAITYGDPMPEFTLSYSGFVNGEDASVLDEEPQISTTAGPDADAGTYTITLSGGSDDNYAFSFTEGTLTIGQAAQTITFEEIADVDMASQTSVFLSASASSGLAVTFTLIEGDGTIEGNTLTLNSTGNFVVEASQAGNTNYLPAESVTRSFVVTDSQKEDQSISFEAISNAIYGDQISLSATATSGLPVSFSVVSGPATISGGEVSFTGIGTVVIETNQAGDADFNPAPSVEQSFDVLPAKLEVTADDQTTVFNEAIPQLTYSISGFVNDEDESVLTSAPTATTAATAGDDAGTYAITVSGGEVVNYAFTYTDGTLTIEKAQATITLSDLEQEANGTAKLPTVTTDPADLIYTITFDGEADAPVEAGEYQVEVVIDEINYQGSATDTFVINEAENVLGGLGDIELKVYPNPVADYLQIEGNASRVRLVTTQGKILLDIKAVDGNASMDIRSLRSGVYLLSITDGNGTSEIRRIIKQ